MNHISDSVRGLSFIVRLNLDRLLFVAAFSPRSRWRPGSPIPDPDRFGF
jgi:hypothetical protein